MVAAVESVPILAGRVFKVTVPDSETPVTAPYVTVYPGDGADVQRRMGAGRQVSQVRFTLHLVGVSSDQVQAITSLVKAKFVTNGVMRPPVVAGTRQSQGWWSTPAPVASTTGMVPQMTYQVIQLGWDAEPA